MKISHWQKVLVVVLVFAVIGTLLVWAFLQGRSELALEKEKERPFRSTAVVSRVDGETVLTISEGIQTTTGVETIALETATRREEFKAYGTALSFNALSALRDRYVTAKARLESTEASYVKSSKIYQRRHQLFEERIISWEALQGIKASRRADEARLSSARAALQVMRSQIQQQWGPVLAKWLYEESPEFNRLSSQHEVLIQVTLPADLMIKSPPETALVDTSYGTKVCAKLVSPSPRTDPRIQGQSFFYVVPARGARILPGMNLLAHLSLGPAQGVFVPEGAVVWSEGRAWVYLRINSDRFVRREISTGKPLKRGWLVSKGLKPGDRVVVTGSQLLLSTELHATTPPSGQGD